ncbi:putative germin-like protein 2-1 [Iris pallida]|uniref:Germin-like protein 2-1 n=1 Tax=Iris pallida TaxID=29817 RepID=A0AAX6EFT7_IRIPA|nr:putative germin-like protein 2-1 [Iris pallida]
MVTPVAAGQPSGLEHPWHFPGPHRLRALRAQPAPHPPAGHRDPDRTRRLPLRRVRDVQSRQQTLRQGPSQGRRLRVPPGARALPAQLWGGRRGGDRGAEQPEPRRDHGGQRRLRGEAAHFGRCARQGV